MWTLAARPATVQTCSGWRWICTSARPICGSRSAPSQPDRSSSAASIHHRIAWITRMSASRSITVVPPGRGFSASVLIAASIVPQQEGLAVLGAADVQHVAASGRPADARPDPRSARRRTPAPCARPRRRGAAASPGRRPSRRAARGRSDRRTPGRSHGVRDARCDTAGSRRASSRVGAAPARSSQASPSATKWKIAWSSAGRPSPHGAVSSLWQ